MASPACNAVSVDRSYLDTLIRRAQFNAGEDLHPSHPTITITRAEYNTLVKTAREFANLRGNLMRGGVTEDTLAVLTSNESKWQQDVQQIAGPTYPAPYPDTQPPIHRPRQAMPPTAGDSQPGYQTARPTGQQRVKPDWAEMEDDVISDPGYYPVETQHQHDSNPQEQVQEPLRAQYERMATRTVIIVNLPQGTTHADITAAVRGGLLLDIFLRSHDRSAQVSFLRSTDARGFFDHARRHDFYVNHKRVDIRWSDRQFVLPGHVASKIGTGATRNLIVRRCDPRITEEGIRDDLEHIHNLTIVQVTFRGGSCYISTNSVHNAMYARTCMMSRAYKGSKIDWDVDECAQPLAIPQHHQVPIRALPTKHAKNPMANRFQLLNLDDDDDDGENVPPEFHSQASLGVELQR